LDRYHFFTQTAFFEKHWQLEDFVRYLQSPRANWVDRETYTYYILDIIARFTLREKGKVDGDVKRLMKLWNGLLIQLAHC
jgi:thiamine biosynthesis lipoprotein ApbE